MTAEQAGRFVGVVLALSLWAAMTAVSTRVLAGWASVFSWLGD